MNQDNQAWDVEGELSDEELEAAVVLATLPFGDPLPPGLRQRVVAEGESVLARRARLHARRRAAGAAPADAAGARAMASTTSAGSQVVATSGEPDRLPSRPLVAWAGWALAAAAAIALFVTQRSGPPPAGAGESLEPSALPDPQRIALRGASDAAGELIFDRGGGAASLRLDKAPGLDPEREALEVWVRFEGDTTPSPLALLEGRSATTRVGEGRSLCRTLAARPGRCLPAREVLVTREGLSGSVVFASSRVVLSGRSEP